MTLIRRIFRRAIGCCCTGGGVANVDDEEVDYIVVLDEDSIQNEQEYGDQHFNKFINHIEGQHEQNERTKTDDELRYVPPKNTLRLISKYEKSTTTLEERDESSRIEKGPGGDIATPRQQQPDQPILRRRQSSPRKSFGSPNLQPCDLCHGKIYPFDAITKSFGKTFHASCFKCNACGVKMKNEPLEQHHETQDGLWLTCSRCQMHKLQERTPLVIGRVAGSRILVEDEELGDIDGVMDMIGEELSDLLVQGALLPTCAVCGTDFIGYNGKVTIIGSLKYHNDCWLLGKPCPFDKCLTAIQATKYLPGRLIVKLLAKDGSSASPVSSNTGRRSRLSTVAPLATMFFTWKTREGDLKEVYNSAIKSNNKNKSTRNSRLVIYYDVELNNSSKGSTTDTLGHSPCRSYEIEFAGNPFGESYQPTMLASTVTKSETGLNTIHFKLGVEKYHVLHYIQLSIPMINDCELDLTRPYLIVQLEREKGGNQQGQVRHKQIQPQLQSQQGQHVPATVAVSP